MAIWQPPNLAGIIPPGSLRMSPAARVTLWGIGGIMKLIEKWGTDMNRILTFTLCALMLSAPALAQTASQQHQIFKDKPSGLGDPDAISCYRPVSSFSRVRTLDCRTNAEWGQLAGNEHRGGTLDLGNRAGGAAVNVMH